MSKFLEKSIKYLVAISFVVPLFFGPFVWSSYIFPFIVPKVVLFRSLVLLMLGCYILLLFINFQKYKLKNTPVTVAVLLFFLSFALSTFLGVDWYKSFWDNHERMLGLFTVFHYVLYYVIATHVLRTWEEWRFVFRSALFLGSAVIFLGLIQKINPEFLLNQGNVRVSATLGNAIYYAGYGLFLGFVGLYLFFREQTKGWKYTSLALGILGFSATFLSSTRGTLLGILVGTLVTLLLYAFRAEVSKKVKFGILYTLLGGAIVLSVLFLFRHHPVVSSVPALGKLLNASSEITEKSPRLMAWGIAVDSWQEKPVFGWGPNNYYYAFNKHYRPEYLNFGWGETWFDNAHNVILNTMAVQGMFGLLTYVGLFAVSIIFLAKKYRKNELDVHTTFLGIGFLVAHFVHNIFVFENPTSYLYFFFFLAFVNSVVSPSVVEKQKGANKSVSIIHYGGVVAIICYLIYSTNVVVAKGNVGSFYAIQAVYSGQNIMDTYEEAISIKTPHRDDVRTDVARAVLSALSTYGQVNRLKDIEPLFNLAYKDMQKNRALHPLDIRVHLQEAQMAQTGAQLFQRPHLLQEAEVVLDDALIHSPKRQQTQYMLAMLSFQLGKPQKAEKLLTESIQNNPRIEEGWWRLALVYIYAGRPEQASKIIQQAEAQGVVFEPSRKQNLQNLITSVSSTSSTPRPLK